MIDQLNMSGKTKVETAIERIKTFEPPEGYFLAFSGGKDSVVIKALKAEAVQDEAAMTKQEILGYLDDVLHPIVSPDNWYVYSDLHDMIGELKNGKTCKQCCHLKKCGKEG